MFNFHFAAALEFVEVPVRSVAQRVPEAQGRLIADVALEPVGGDIEIGQRVPARALDAAAQRRGLEERPVPPRGSRQAVLKEHPDDSEHGQAPVGYLRAEFLLPEPSLLDGAKDAERSQEALAVVTWFARRLEEAQLN